MFKISDLKSIKMLSNLSEPMLKKIMEISVFQEYGPNEYIFREGDYAEYLFAVLAGKVALEIDVQSDAAVRVKDIYPGRAFGISSVVDTDKRTYISDARTLQDSSVFCWKSSDMEKLFYSDFELGFIVIRNVGRALKMRLQSKRAQLGQELYTAHM